MKLLSPRERRQLEKLEQTHGRPPGWRLALIPLIDALGGLAFAWWMRYDSPLGSRSTLGEELPAFAAVERALGPLLAFYLLCAVSFLGVALLVGWRAIRASEGLLATLRTRAIAEAAAARTSAPRGDRPSPL